MARPRSLARWTSSALSCGGSFAAPRERFAAAAGGLSARERELDKAVAMGLCRGAPALALVQQLSIDRAHIISAKTEPISIVQVIQRMLLPAAPVGSIEKRAMMSLLGRH